MQGTLSFWQMMNAAGYHTQNKDSLTAGFGEMSGNLHLEASDPDCLLGKHVFAVDFYTLTDGQHELRLSRGAWLDRELLTQIPWRG